MARIGWCFRFRSCMSFRTACSARVVLEWGLKAYCVGEIRLCSSRCFISWSFMMVSSSLAMMGSRDMGR